MAYSGPRMTYTVQQLAALAKVTGRTLRHYDRIGLLRPAERGANGYRRYSDADALRLQHILFYRELDLPLSEIKRLLSRPDVDAARILRDQRRLIGLKRDRLGKMLKTIDLTLKRMDQDQRVTAEDLYGDLSKETYEAYQAEAKERWGGTDAYKQSHERVKNMTKGELAAMKAETDRNLKALVALMEAGAPPDSPDVQAEIAAHRAGISRFYDVSDEIYGGLADMYLADQRFADFYRKYHEGLPEFLVAGMKASLRR